MASTELIHHAKFLASNIQTNTGPFVEIKRGHTLEFVARHVYRYQSWNHLSAEKDRPLLGSYRDLINQAIALTDLIGFTLPDDLFEPQPWPFGESGTVPGPLRYLGMNVALAIISAAHNGKESLANVEGGTGSVPWIEWLLSHATASDTILMSKPLLSIPSDLSMESRRELAHIVEERLIYSSYLDPEDEFLLPWYRVCQNVLAVTNDMELAQLAETACKSAFERHWGPSLSYVLGCFDDGKRLAAYCDINPGGVKDSLHGVLALEGRVPEG